MRMDKAAKLVCTVVIALMGLAGPATAQGSGLIRLTDRDDLYGWEAVGRVEIQGKGYCTGVLISPTIVLTAAHCLFDQRFNRVDEGNLQFRAGLRDGHSIAERSIARFAVLKEYNPADGVHPDAIRSDAALLELSKPIPTHIADPFVLHSGAEKGRRVSVVSYGQGRDNALSWQRDCGVLERYRGLMAFDCNVTYGSSGAPVFLKENGRGRILSLISAVGDDDGSRIAFGMELPNVVARLKRVLVAQPKSTPAQSGFRRLRVGQGGGAAGAKFAKP